jgi:hypothetical protein
LDSGHSGISGIRASLDEIPEIPQIPESEVPSASNSNLLEEEVDFAKIACMSLSEIIRLEKKLLNFNDERDYIGVNIGIGMTYILDLLPRTSRIFYVGFSGPKGSGKSTATSFCARVCKNGIKLEGVTYPALADACKDGRTLCLDEFDAQSEKCPELETIVRQGIDLDAHYWKSVPDGKGGWMRDDVPCGGMKFLNWRNPLDDALLQRILIIKMAPGATTRMIVNNEAPQRFTAPIQCWFHAQSALAREVWTSEKVQDLIEDKEDRLTKKLDRLLGKIPRQTQKGFWMLVVCEIFGWDFDDTIKNLIEKQPEDEAYEDYREIVAEIYTQKKELKMDDSPVIIELVDFKKDMVQRVKDKGLYPLRSKGALSWTGLRQECGFVEGISEKKDSKKSGKRILIFDEHVLKAIGIETTRQANLDSKEDSE